MTQIIKDILRRELGNAEDNLNRAKLAFRNQTPEQMQELYGESGQTKQEILDGYQNEYDRIDGELARLCEPESQSSKHCDAGYMNDMRFGTED